MKINKIFTIKMWYYDSNRYYLNIYEEIPSFENEVTKPDTSVNSTEDLTWLLNTMTFWEYTGEIPQSVFTYAYNTRDLKIRVNMPEYSILFNVLELISRHKFREALENNYLFETFRFLVDLRPKILGKKYYCDYAAQNGHLDCLKYAHENGCYWDQWVCNEAARYGHLNCLKYAHENGCPWNGYVYTYAAKNGHLDCLIYAREHGCPWDKDINLRFAGNDEIKEYVKSTI